jgi:hypothetical protein
MMGQILSHKTYERQHRRNERKRPNKYDRIGKIQTYIICTERMNKEERKEKIA